MVIFNLAPVILSNLYLTSLYLKVNFILVSVQMLPAGIDQLVTRLFWIQTFSKVADNFS